MDLTHTFTVPTSVDETWAHFNDIASVAECFPGATVTSVDGDSFSGSVKVKLGPIALLYNGSGTFQELDEAAHRFVVDAKGRDKRGNGTAGAKVTLTMAPAADGTSTDVVVVTDLAITGKPAQFGRGVMQDVSDKLLGQFVACLEQRLAAGPAAATGVAPEEPAAGIVPDEVVDSGPANEPVRQGVSPDATPQPPAEPSAEPSAEPPAGVVPDEVVVSGPANEPARRGVSRDADRDDALNLGATVLPVLVKTYWKPVVGVAVVVGLVVWWATR